MATTLMLFGKYVERALNLLGEDDAHAYGDNGGDPDGNAWLPSEIVDGDLADEVAQRGWGEFVHVLYANDEAMMNIAGYPPVEWPDDARAAEILTEGLKSAAEDKYAGWAHYGAYGAGDSKWVLMTK